MKDLFFLLSALMVSGCAVTLSPVPSQQHRYTENGYYNHPINYYQAPIRIRVGAQVLLRAGHRHHHRRRHTSKHRHVHEPAPVSRPQPRPKHVKKHNRRGKRPAPRRGQTRRRRGR